MTRLVRVEPGAEQNALEFCARFPVQSVVVAGWLQEGGLLRNHRTPKAWLFEVQPRRAEGLVYVSDAGILIPILPEGRGLEALVEFGRRHPHAARVIVGERWLVEHICQRWARFGFRCRMERDQTAYSIEQGSLVAPAVGLPLRTATLADLDALVDSSARMAREEARDDPQRRNPRLFKARIRDRILRGRDFVHYLDERLAFKTNVSALSSVGGQIEGIFTEPELRGRGLGRKGTAEVTRWILEKTSRASLLVNDDNWIARRLYGELGFTPVYESRTAFSA